MSVELSRLKSEDYQILDSGKYKVNPGSVVGVDSPEFGLAATDYIEMVISTPTGVFLDSFVIARGSECTQYKTLDEDDNPIFSINPGIFMREKGYFSGEYNIEFNFLREVAGSEQGVLVDKENKIYNGTRFVNNNGLIYKGGETNPDELEKDEFLLREKDYKFYVDEISADRTELRLGTLPIRSLNYQTEFKGLGSDKIVLDYDKTLQDTGTNTFQILDLQSNTLPQNIIGGELVIRDAYKIPGLNISSETFDTLVGLETDKNYRFGKTGLHTYGMSLRNVSRATTQALARPDWSNNERHSAIYGGDNDYYKNTKTDNFFGFTADGTGNPTTLNGYDSEQLMQFVNDNNQKTAETSIANRLFRDIGTGGDETFSHISAARTFIAGKKANPGKLWWDGAAVIGWTSYHNYGFPLWIRCNEPELQKFKSGGSLETSLVVRVSGRATTTDTNGQLRDYGVEEYKTSFDGENSFIRIPKHKEYQTKKGKNYQNDIQGAIFDMELIFSVKFSDIERTYTIKKPSVFNVVPDDNSAKKEEHIESGFN